MKSTNLLRNQYGLPIVLLTIIAISFYAFGCSKDDEEAPPIARTGVFVDSAVSGLAYITGTKSGITDEKGTFNYMEGETVTFKIGDIVLGETVKAQPFMSPLEVVSGAGSRLDPRVNNIVRFLLSLDSDLNPDNGIQLTDAIKAKAVGKQIDFSDETNVAAVLASLYDQNPPALVDSTTAQTHFTKSLLQKLLDEKVASQNIPGLVLATYIPGETEQFVVTSGYSDLAHKTPITRNDKFRIGSITKTFVAITTLQLAQEGKLGLDDPIENYLPGLVPNGINITIRELLNHTSGLFNFIKNDNFLVIFLGDPLRYLTHEEVLNFAFEKLPYSAPGKEWHYANTNYVILGMLIEKITGNTLESEITTRCIQPVNLTNTMIPLAGEKKIPEPFAHGYLDAYEESGYLFGRDGELLERSEQDASQSWGNGNMISLPSDLTQWITAIGQGRMLNATFQEEMRTYVPARTGLMFGLGIAYLPAANAIGHSGQLYGYDCSCAFQLDTQLPISVCANRTIAAGASVESIVVVPALQIVLGVGGEGSGEHAVTKKKIVDTSRRGGILTEY